VKESTDEYMLNYKVSKLQQESNKHSILATHMEVHQESALPLIRITMILMSHISWYLTLSEQLYL